MIAGMSVIEDTRKVLQDFVAPELRAIDSRLTSLEKRFDVMQKHTERRFDEAGTRTDQQFSSIEQKMDLRFEQVLAEIRSLKTVHDLELRMAKIEAVAYAAQANIPRPESEAA